LDFLKSNALLAIRKLWIEHESDHVIELKVYDKPRGVEALKEFKKGKLILVPASRNISTRKPTADVPHSAADLGQCMCDGLKDAVSLHVSPMFSYKAERPWVAPFWIVKRLTEEDASESNMEWTTKPVQIVVGSSTVFRIDVPVMVNSKTIEECDELAIVEPESSRSAKRQKT